VSDFSRQAEKLSLARRCLMLPHSKGAEIAIADAFTECYYAFYHWNEAGLDDNARRWVTKIKELMGTAGSVDSIGGAPWEAQARTLSVDQQLELRDAVDELANWFNEKETCRGDCRGGDSI
jgi:hypothetical protein